MIDCSQLPPGRPQCICTGTNRDGSRIDMTSAERVKYLRAFFPNETNEQIVEHVGGHIRGLGDVVALGIKAATLGMVKPCGGCQKRQEWLNRIVPFGGKSKKENFGSAFRYTGGEIRFVKSAQFQEDIKLLLGKIPHDVTAIAGVARSGLSAATMLSMYLHLPMLTIRQTMNDIVPTGNGWRLGGSKHVDPKTQKILIVDDTCMTGNSLKAIRPLVQEKFGNAMTATVYCNPLAKVKPDIHAVDLGWPHILEWNVFNSILSPTMALDFDGVLCRDCEPWQDDDGHNYVEWMKNATPLYVPRRTEVPLVVTARIEKYRGVTEEWLDRYGIRVRQLIMHQAATLRERNRDDIAAYKARHFTAWAGGLKKKGVGPLMFVESDDRQAQRIGKISGMLCVCPHTGNVYS